MAFFKDPLAGIAYPTNQLPKADMNDWITGIREAYYTTQAAAARTWLYETDITATVANFLAKCCAFSHGLGLWVIPGSISGSAADAIVTTPDYVSFTQQTVPVGTATSINAVATAWQASTIVAGCDDGTFRRSTDGTTWASASPAAISSVTCMHQAGRCGGNYFLAGSTGEVEVSTTGTTWLASTAFPASLATHPIYDISDNANSSSPVLVAVGYSTSHDKCARSVDGATWTEGTMPTSSTWVSVTWSHQLAAFIAVNHAGTEWATSTDGVSWSSMSVTTAPPTGISMIRCMGHALIAVISSSGNIYASLDSGVNWHVAHTSAGTLSSISQRALGFAESATGGGQFASAANVYFNAAMSLGY